MLLVSGLKLVNVPTLMIGIVLLASVIVLMAIWVWIRAGGRTLREVSGESTMLIPTRRSPRRKGQATRYERSLSWLVDGVPARLPHAPVNLARGWGSVSIRAHRH